MTTLNDAVPWQELLNQTDDGLVHVDDAGFIRAINLAASALLDGSVGDSIREVGIQLGLEGVLDVRGQRSRLTVSTSAEKKSGRLFEITTAPAAHGTTILLHDITEQSSRDQRLLAFASTANSIAYTRGLSDVLDEVVAATVHASGAAAGTIVIVDPTTGDIDRVGKAGGYPDDYKERLEACIRLGAPLASLNAYQTSSVVIRENWSQVVLQDERWAPVHSFHQRARWGSLAAVPLTSRRGSLGALTVFYQQGREPSANDIDFLKTVSEQVAVAVENYRMVAELNEQAVQSERQRLARELHDAVSQVLYSLNLQARSLGLNLAKNEAAARERALASVAEIESLTLHALTEMRALIFELRPQALHQDGIVSAVRTSVSAVAARSGLKLTFESSHNHIPMAEDAAHAAFRVIQEAVNNVAKHSRAQNLKVRIGVTEYDPSGVEFIVSDDGHGFDVAGVPPGTLGLDSMRTRVEELRGSVSLTSGDAGTVVSVFLPAALAGRPS